MKRKDFFGPDVERCENVQELFTVLYQKMEFDYRYLENNYGLKHDSITAALREGTMNAITLAHVCLATGETSATPLEAVATVRPLVDAFCTALYDHLVALAYHAAKV